MPSISNQNPTPQMPITLEEHHRLLRMAIIVGAVAMIIGMLYWWSTSGRVVAPVSTEQDPRALVAELLRSSTVQVSQQDIDHVAAQLSASNVTVTDEQKQAVANSLRSHSSISNF